VIIKMNIEGAEWDALLATPNELLASIPQISMEMHGFRYDPAAFLPFSPSGNTLLRQIDIHASPIFIRTNS
jgi:hypothetical protein